MKFLIVNRHRDDTVGGSEIQCDLIARELQARGHDVTYAVMRPRGALSTSPYPCVALRPPVALAFGRVLRAVRPDVVYWRFNKAHLLACALQARLARAVFVFACSHDDDTRAFGTSSGAPPTGSPRAGGRALLGRLRRAWWRLEGGLNSLGHALADGHVAQHRGQAEGLRAETTRVIHSSVLSERAPFRWQRPFVVWVANLKARKRPEAFLELARALADEPLDFLAVGALQDPRYAYFGEPGRLPANLHWLGARSPAEVNGIIAAARFLVLTCEPEGFPNVSMQAWDQGRAVVSLAYDPEDLIRDQGLGYVEGSPAALAQRVRALNRDEGEREAIGARAREVVGRTFTAGANVAELERFCRELLARRGRT